MVRSVNCVLSTAPFLASAIVQGVIEKTFLLFSTTIRVILSDDPSSTRLSQLKPVLSLLEATLPRQSAESLLSAEHSRDLIISVFDAGYFIPFLYNEGQAEEAKVSAREIWKALLERSGEKREELVKLVIQEARKKLEDTTSRIS